MPDALQPLRFVLLVFAGLVHRDQARVLAFLQEENRVLREERDILKRATVFFAKETR